ncbi:MULTISPECIES: hypothetical protein [Pseudanabaena]|uniref:Uncharacterized protein n=1 Tax=Pseudanabaena catenata USMAC16 TaxID=1855837 RepID=A0A9X4RJ36_9CYAN|nr:MULTISPECIES: hypothetical protein [Pseudanabaena]MDG3496693.1 hypothetical protein [Pseudanabaena catenata USMAC16]
MFSPKGYVNKEDYDNDDHSDRYREFCLRSFDSTCGYLIAF